MGTIDGVHRCHAGNGDHYAVGDIRAHNGRMVEIGNGQYQSRQTGVYSRGVSEKSFADAEIRTHIEANFLDVNEHAW